MRRSRRLVLPLLALVLLGATCVPGIPNQPPGPKPFALPALRAAADPVRGGRIVDAYGREVILRGVNSNAFVEYWAYSPILFTNYPLTADDADRMAAIGFDVVRLGLSWSRIEPMPGVYDEAYLDAVEGAVKLLESRGLWTILDLHQDAWGPTLAARPDEDCRGRGRRAIGWDGAPAWATLDGGLPRCAPNGVREFSPAVQEAFAAFWRDDPGPGGIGIRARYVAMLAHLAGRFARHDAVAGYDLMNEPNAIFLFPGQLDALAAFYGEAIPAIRAAETAAGAPRRIVFFEPGITWADFGPGAPPTFPHDDQVAYSPHVYQGGISPVPLGRDAFQRARDEAAAYGGAPVLVGEWGSDPRRAADPADGYFDVHLAFQDEFRFGSTLWTWREACGDPHKAGEAASGGVPYVWGLFDVDCTTNRTTGMRDPLRLVLTRPLLRAAPSPIEHLAVDATTRVLEADGRGARAWKSFVAFVPGGVARPRVTAQGLRGIHFLPAPGGARYVAGFATGGDWSLRIEPQP